MSRYRGIMQKVYRAIKSYGMLARGMGVTAALSGGADSVFLLHSLLQAGKTYDLRISALHVHHGARGDEADGDEAFCRELCDRWGVPLEVHRYDVPGYARERGVSFEEAGHLLRREAYGKSMESFGSQRVATGHTADDQAETILMRLLTGTGVSGLGGIQPVFDSWIIRPLLSIRKSEIMEYLEGEGIPWRVDMSNMDPGFLRNRIRLTLLPLLRNEFNPGIELVLSRMAEVFREEARFLEGLVVPYLDQLERKGDEYILPVGVFREIPGFALSFFIREAIRKIRGECKDITFVHLDSVGEMAEKGTGYRVLLPGGLLLERRYDSVVFRVSGEEEVIPPLEAEVELPGEHILPAWGFRIRGEILSERPADLWGGFDQALFDADMLGSGVFLIRPRRRGDRFRPLGMERSKKLKDFLIDEKVPVEKRNCIPLLEKDGEIIWVIGVRPGDRFRVREDTRRFFMVRREQFEGECNV